MNETVFAGSATHVHARAPTYRRDFLFDDILWKRFVNARNTRQVFFSVVLLCVWYAFCYFFNLSYTILVYYFDLW